MGASRVRHGGVTGAPWAVLPRNMKEPGDGSILHPMVMTVACTCESVECQYLERFIRVHAIAMGAPWVRHGCVMGV